MFSSKQDLTKINNCQKRALRAVYNNYKENFECLLQLSGSSLIHTVHLRFVMSEVFKSLHRLNPKFMSELFIEKKLIYQLRKGSQLIIPIANTITFGLNSVFFRASILWNSLPNNMKNVFTLNLFNINIKKWQGEN